MITIPDAWKADAYAAVIVAVLGTIGGLMISRANLQAELAAVRADIVLCRNVNESWVVKTAEVNAAIRKMQDAAARREQKAKRTAVRASHISEQHRRNAEKILSEKARDDECHAIKNLFADDAARRKR